MNKYDETSVRQVSGYLDQCGYAPSATEGEYDCVDLIARDHSGRFFGVEVKNRSFPHDRYDDVMTDYSKYAYGISAIDAGRFSNMIVASIYNDNILCFSNITAGSACPRIAPQTTYYGGGQTLKMLWKMPQQKTVKIGKE